MAWSYRKKIKVIPGIYLNFSKQGISTTIGIKGASLNIGNNGAYLNIGIPGTGLYNRTKIENKYIATKSENLIQTNVVFEEEQIDIRPDSLKDIRDSILIAFEQRIELKKDLNKIKIKILFTKFSLFLSTIFHLTNLKDKLLKDYELQSFAISELRNKLEFGFLNLDIQISSELNQQFDNLNNSYLQLNKCHKIWQIDNFEVNDTFKTRSSIGLLMDRKEIKFSQNQITEINTQKKPINFTTVNGTEFYIYPCFIIAYKSATNKLDVFTLEKFTLKYTSITYVEEEIVPADSKIVYYTWEKVNKDGSRDRRFASNRQIPVAEYGQLDIIFNSCYKVSFMFSNSQKALNFEKMLNNYLDLTSI